MFQIPQTNLKVDRFQVLTYHFEINFFYQDWLDAVTKSKSHYVVNSLSKIRHKGWELYVVSRIIHLLDDLEIEFVCQQLVRKKDGNRYLVDLYFPQFGIYIEIDEAHHLNEGNVIKDKLRQREILEATNLEEIRIPIVDADKKERSLQEINGDIQANIEKIKTLKAAQISDKTFVPWQAGSRYNPQTYIQKGSIEVSSNVALRRQVDVIRLFGTEFKGWQKGTWPWKNPIEGTNYQIWFPRLYKARGWTNSISDNGLKIQETKTNGDRIDLKIQDYDRIVFGHYKNVLGQTVYRFMGVFNYSKQESDEFARIFNRIDDKLDILPFQHGGLQKIDHDGYYIDKDGVAVLLEPIHFRYPDGKT